MNKLIVASIVAAGLGVGLQSLTRSSVEDMEAQATVAWNAGDTNQAEHLARRILAKAPESRRAQDVLQQLTFHSPRPVLAVALETLRTAGDDVLRQSQKNGDAALDQNLLKVAEAYWTEGLRTDPSNAGIRYRLITLAGIRLDAQEMQNQLLKLPAEEPLNGQLVLLCLSGFTFDAHGVLPAETQLRRSLEADSTDVKTRLALARALTASGRHAECQSILSDMPTNESVASLLAVSFCENGKEDAASDLLPDQPPAESAADFYLATALIRAHDGNHDAELSAWRNAIQERPLSGNLRAQYCDALRKIGNSLELQEATEALNNLREINEIASGNDTLLTASTIARLRALCDAVGASNAATLLTRVVPVEEQP